MSKARRILVTAAAVAAITLVTSACQAPLALRVTPFAGTGTAGYGGDGGPALDAELEVQDIAIGPDGDVFLLSTNSLRKVDGTGTITTVAGTGVFGYSGDGGPATSAQIRAEGVDVDDAGNIYIADAYSNRVRKVDTGGTITTIAGTGVYGFSGDGGPATSAQLARPYGVTVDGAGNVYIADGDNSRVRKVDTGGTITTIAGTGVYGSSGDGGPATSAQLGYPWDVEFGPDGALYLSDNDLYQVRRIDTGGTITTVAGIAGNGLWTGDGGAATSATLSYPKALAFDAKGNLYIADEGHNVIRKITPAGIISTFAGTPNVAGDLYWGPPTEAKFTFPSSVAVDASGAVYVADRLNRKVLLIDRTGGAINGVVRDESDAPIAGVTVELWEPGADAPTATDVTDANGHYGFSVMPGTWTLFFDGPPQYLKEWYLDAGSWVDATEIDVPAKTSLTIDAVLALDPG